MRLVMVIVLVVIAVAVGFGAGWLVFHEGDRCADLRGAERILCDRDVR